MASHSYVDVPLGWRRATADGPGWFVTREQLIDPEGRLHVWRSRGHRKGRAAGRHTGVWWRPDRLGWWIGVLFAIGSVCFAVASMLSQWASVPRPGIGVTFFVGSLFFTTAAGLQLHEAINVERGPEQGSARSRRLWSWEPDRIDWLAAAIQFAGTLCFNVSTFLGMQHGLTAHEADLRVWTPDVVGSICFLVASELAYAEVCNRWVCLRTRSLSWWIVALNMIGSIAFGISAAAALVEPSTNEPVSAVIANAGTTLGALCFLAGGLLLLPETDREEAAS